MLKYLQLETQAVLDALNAELHYPVAILGETNTPGSVDVAILATGELRQVFPPRQHRLLLALDHLYLTKTTLGMYLQGSAKVHRDETEGGGGSDHAALSADFILLMK